MEELLALYTSEHTYNIEDMWEDYRANDLFSDEDALLTKEEFYKKYKDSDEFYEWANDLWQDVREMHWDDMEYEANKILGSKDFVKVSGSIGRWNGNFGVDMIIRETDLQSIIDKYMNLDSVSVEVYADRVEFENSHHDGTNYYTFTPFSFGDLTKAELLSKIDKDHYEWYGDKLYKAKKDDLINYLNDNVE